MKRLGQQSRATNPDAKRPNCSSSRPARDMSVTIRRRLRTSRPGTVMGLQPSRRHHGARAARSLVRLYVRYPIRRRSWEFPQGSWPAGSSATGSPEDLARVELAEETGLRAGSIRLLGFLHEAPGFCSQGFSVWLATDLRSGPTDREPSESDMQQRWVPAAARRHDPHRPRHRRGHHRGLHAPADRPTPTMTQCS